MHSSVIGSGALFGDGSDEYCVDVDGPFTAGVTFSVVVEGVCVVLSSLGVVSPALRLDSSFSSLESSSSESCSFS
jgi:hypothetical protein